jgi:hypothetical protein
MNKLFSGVGLIFLAVLLLIPVSGFAAFEIHPRLTLSEEYNDNIFLDAEDEEDDFITTIAPGLLLNYRAKELLLDVDYSLLFRKYASNTDEDETDFKDIQRGLATAEIFPDRNFTISLLGEISSVTVDESGPTADDDGSENRTILYRYIINPQYHFRKIPTYEVVFDYLLEGRDYVADEGDDSVSNQAGVELIKTFSRRLSTSLGYRFEDFNGSSSEIGGETVSDDFERQDVFVTVVYELSSQLRLDGRGGLVWIDYDERDGTDGTLWGLGIEYFPSVLFSARLDYSEDFESSVEDGLEERKRASLLLSYLGKIPVSLEVFNDRVRREEIDEEDEETGGVLTATIPFGSRLSLLASGSYTYSEYDPDDEEVDEYGARASLEYVTRYITFLLSQSFREGDSNIEENDYTNNITFLSARMEF